MAEFQMIVLTNPVAGRADEFRLPAFDDSRFMMTIVERIGKP
jgi:hypothetical protein